MRLVLRVLNGPLKGRFTPVKAGMIFGRGQNRVGLKDPKVSANHAEIVKDPMGKFILRDLNSRNGVKVNGKRVSKLSLKPGLQFQIGQTFLRVEPAVGERGDMPRKPKPVDELPPVPEKLESIEPEEEPEIEVPPPDWPEFFEDFITENSKNFKNESRELIPFPKLVQFKFLKGPQIDEVWSMGYGPRNVGRGSLDYPLYDEAAPELAFRVRAQGPDIIIESPHSKLVQINNKFISTEELSDGDLISIGSSLIRVQLKE